MIKCINKIELQFENGISTMKMHQQSTVCYYDLFTWTNLTKLTMHLQTNVYLILTKLTIYSIYKQMFT